MRRAASQRQEGRPRSQSVQPPSRDDEIMSTDLHETPSASTSLKELSPGAPSSLPPDALVTHANGPSPSHPRSSIKKTKSHSFLPSHPADTIPPDANPQPLRSANKKASRQGRDSCNDALMSSTDTNDLPTTTSRTLQPPKRSLLRDLSDLETTGRSSLEEFGDESPAEEVLSEEKHLPSTPLRYHATTETVLSSPAKSSGLIRTPTSREPLALMDQLQRKRRSKRRSREGKEKETPSKTGKEKNSSRKKNKSMPTSPSKGKRPKQAKKLLEEEKTKLSSPSHTEESKGVRMIAVPPRGRGASQEVSHTMSTDDDAEVERAQGSPDDSPAPVHSSGAPSLEGLPCPIPIAITGGEDEQEENIVDHDSTPTPATETPGVEPDSPKDDHPVVPTPPVDQEEEALVPEDNSASPVPSVALEEPDPSHPEPKEQEEKKEETQVLNTPPVLSVPSPEPVIPSPAVKKKRFIPMIVVSAEDVTESRASELSVQHNPPVPSLDEVEPKISTARPSHEDEDDSIDDSYDISVDDDALDASESSSEASPTNNQRTATALLRMMGVSDPVDSPVEEEKNESPRLPEEAIYVKRKAPQPDDPCRYVEIGKGAPVLKNLKGVQIESETGKKIKENLEAQRARRFISVGGGSTESSPMPSPKEK